MIERLLTLGGVSAVCSFRDDGVLLEGHGSLSEETMAKLARFAHGYTRMVQGNTDQFSLFTGIRSITPPERWVVRGERMTLCGAGNLVCAVRTENASLNQVLGQLDKVSGW
jgi:roadblock/LC7 domain-containing protein